MGEQTETYGCGHAIADGNMMPDGRHGHRCRTCHRERSLQHYHNQARREARKQPEEAPGLRFDNAMYERGMETASNRLLTALYREHPYVFDAAERSGRLVVRP